MLLGAILGLLGSLVPEALKFLRDWHDKKHELKMLELQIKYQKELAEIRIAEARALATLELDKETYHFAQPEFKPTGRFVLDLLQVFANFYNTTVRPTLTYLVVLCWLLVKFAMWQNLGGSLVVLPHIWTSSDNEFVSAVVMFWFGGRAFQRVFNRV